MYGIVDDLYLLCFSICVKTHGLLWVQIFIVNFNYYYNGLVALAIAKPQAITD